MELLADCLVLLIEIPDAQDVSHMWHGIVVTKTSIRYLLSMDTFLDLLESDNKELKEIIYVRKECAHLMTNAENLRKKNVFM